MEAIVPLLIIALIGSLVGALMLFFSFLLSKFHKALVFLIPSILVGFSVAYFIELYQNTYGLEGIPLVIFGLLVAFSAVFSLIGSIIIFVVKLKRTKGNN